MGRGEGAVGSLNSPAWESREYHAAGSKAQSSGQKAEELMAEKQQLISTGRGCKTKAEPEPATHNPEGPTNHIL